MRVTIVAIKIPLLGLALFALTSYAPPVPTPDAENAIKFVHDPCIIRDKDTYYVFSTGPGIPIRRSKDLIHWELAGRVFPEDMPDWAKQEIPGSRGIWAPDISYFNGRFHLYYAVSRFGRNRSLIALVSNKTLDPASKDYQWVDEGKVFESGPGQDYNAIDPNVVLFPSNHPALTFGSFWSGLKLVFLDARTGKPASDAQVVSLARRPSPDAIEAPFIVHRGRYYYLFASFDFCCRGVNSTYNIRIGRAAQITGPYLDRDGKALLEGGGTLLLGTQGNLIGPGGCSILQDRRKDFLVYHFYDGADRGIPTLQIRPLTWTADGWPTAAAPLPE